MWLTAASVLVCTLAISPNAKFEPPQLGAARWTDGFWASRFETCWDQTLDALERAMRDPANGAQLSNFEIVGQPAAEHRGNNWSDGDVYKWIEAMARVYAVTRDEALDRKMDEWIEKIARTQADDGYISTQTQFNLQKERWGMRQYHELYNMGHLITAAVIHYQATGKDSFLKVARKCADYLYTTFQPRPPQLAHFGWNPSQIMGLVDLYRVTGDRRYLELSEIFINMRGSARWPGPSAFAELAKIGDPHPGDQTQDRVPLRKEEFAVGHAVTGAYLYCGAADVVAETGDKELFAAISRIWKDIVQRKMYITGGTAAYHHGLSIRLDPVHEAYGAAYDLPRRTAYNETCANIAHAMFSYRMLALTGEAQYADIMEQTLYNSVLSGISLDGTKFFYTNPLECRQDAPLLSNDSKERWSTWKCFCCPPNIARTIAGCSQWAWGFSNDGVWIHLFGTGEAQGKCAGDEVHLRQESNYPWEGKITITFVKVPNRSVTLRVRIPAWADGATCQVNDEMPQLCTAGTYHTLARTWKEGDVVRVELPLSVRLLESHPWVEQNRNLVAVMRGPIVYCLESVDLPQGVSIDDVILPVEAQWQERFEPGLLGGVVALEADAIRLEKSQAGETLYRPVRKGVKPLRLRLIPYYAWGNRGPGDMTVWLPASHTLGQ